MARRSWYEGGLRFDCTGCAACCRTHGEYAYVYVTERDVARISRYLGTTGEEFRRRYCTLDTDGWLYLTMTPQDCPLLGDDLRCRVYPVRPVQCATWPFWTENLLREVWEGPIAECCPGVGRGRLYSREEILGIARQRDRWYG